MPTISIIGSAGRKDDASRLSLGLYRKAVLNAQRHIEEYLIEESIHQGKKLGWPSVHLISGGAAWMDHIAVSLRKMHPEATLSLHLPCGWTREACTFTPPPGDWKTARTAAYYHRCFSERVGVDTLRALDEALRMPGTIAHYHEGFLQRNLEVGQCDLMLAYTFTTTNVPKDGGTKHCWDHSGAPRKTSISLFSLKE